MGFPVPAWKPVGSVTFRDEARARGFESKSGSGHAFARRHFWQMSGTTVLELVDSRVLRGNPLGDPHVRRVPVYLPPSYGSRPDRRFPVFYLLHGFTGVGEVHTYRSAWSETFPDRCDRLIASGRMKEALVVMVDGWTAYGGSQFLNSSATGRYEDHVVRELVPLIDRRFRTLAHPAARAILGKSSGGYGALVLAMRHPDVFGHVACHSGDMYFEYCYAFGFPAHLNIVRKHGGTAGFLRAWRRMPKRNDSKIHDAINTIAMASCYSPNPESPLGFDLPFDEKTGEMRPAVWRRWLAWDPVRMLPRHVGNLKKLRTRFLDCGTRDQFHLQWGARIFAAKARALGVPFRHEEFDDDHFGIGYRYDRSLEILSKRIPLPRKGNG